MHIVDLGIVSYKKAYAIQLNWHKKVLAGADSTLLLLEHPPTITLGKNGGQEFLHVSSHYLKEHNIDLVQTERGGSITCHFPGQLVAYPIFRLDKRKGGVKTFFHDMEQVVIQTLADFTIDAWQIPGRAGVFCSTGKICSMGIAVRRWVSFHGLALNVTSTALFQHITLCGLPDTVATSVYRELAAGGYRDEPDFLEVKHVLREKFKALFTHPPVVAHETAHRPGLF